MTMNYISDDYMFSIKVSDDNVFDWLYWTSGDFNYLHTYYATLLITTVTSSVHFYFIIWQIFQVFYTFIQLNDYAIMFSLTCLGIWFGGRLTRLPKVKWSYFGKQNIAIYDIYSIRHVACLKQHQHLIFAIYSITIEIG